MDRVIKDKRSVPRNLPLMKGWTSQHLQDRENEEIDAGKFGLGLIQKRYVHNLEQEDEQEEDQEEEEEQEEENEDEEQEEEMEDEEDEELPQEKSSNVDDNGVESSLNLLPKEFLQKVVKNILMMNYGKMNLIRAFTEAPLHIKSKFAFELMCDMARSALGSQTSPIESVNEKFVNLSTFLEDKVDNFDNWKTIIESIVTIEKEKEALEDLTEFPTFRYRHLVNKVSTSFCLHMFL